jgi:hypothetical protein
MFCSVTCFTLPFESFHTVSKNSGFLDVQNIRFDIHFLLYVAILLPSDIVMYHIVSKKRDGDKQAVFTPLRPASNCDGLGSRYALYVDCGHVPNRREMREGRRLERRDEV